MYSLLTAWLDSGKRRKSDMGRRGAPPDRGGQLEDERHHRFDAELAKIFDGARALTAVDVMALSAEMLRDAGAIAVIIGGACTTGKPTPMCGRRHWRHAAPDFAPSSAWARPAHSARMDRRWRWWTHSSTGSVPDGASAKRVVVAYELVWAIGSGLTPTPTDIAEMHGFIRRRLVSRFGAEGQGISIIYGGSA